MEALHYPERAELPDRRGRMASASAGALACAAAGGLIVWSGSALGWLAIGLGVLFLPLMAAMTIWPVRLVVEPDGFGLTSLMGGSLTAWADVSAFRAGVAPYGGFGGRTLIMYDRMGKRTPGVLLAEFDVNPHTLAEQLETYRNDALFAR